jgi:hypothetical protein
MRIGLVVHFPKGVERGMPMRDGLDALDEAARLIQLIRPEIERFHQELLVKFQQLEAAGAMPLQETSVPPRPRRPPKGVPPVPVA